jgi:hypothetical protein
MNVIELKNWINNLPSKFDEYTVVNGEYGMIDEEYMYRVDKPINTIVIDEDSNEMVLLHDMEDNVNNES